MNSIYLACFQNSDSRVAIQLKGFADFFAEIAFTLTFELLAVQHAPDTDWRQRAEVGCWPPWPPRRSHSQIRQSCSQSDCQKYFLED